MSDRFRNTLLGFTLGFASVMAVWGALALGLLSLGVLEFRFDGWPGC